MTVQSTVPFRKDYEANGTTNVFAYPFQIYDAADLTVYLNGTVKTLNTDYTVSDVGNANGGNITFTMTDSNDDPVDIADGDKISIVMDMDLDRTTNYQPSGAFLAADVNDDFDRLWLATNQQAQEIDRSLRLKADDITTSNMEIPAKDDRKGKLLGFNATTGDPEVSDNNKDNWNAAYNDKINSASFSGSTLTLTQQDGGTVTASHTPYLPIAGGTLTGDLNVGFNDFTVGRLTIDGTIGDNTRIKETGSGDLYLQGTNLKLQSVTNENYINCTADGDVKLYHDGSEKLATTSGGISVTGTITATGYNDSNWNAAYNDKINSASFDTSNGVLTLTQQDGGTVTVDLDGRYSTDTGIALGDNQKATFGDNNDLEIYHDGSNSYIKDSGTGNLRIDATNFYVRNSAGTELKIGALDDGSVDLYYDGAKKLATTSTGIDVTGTVTADGLNTSGQIISQRTDNSAGLVLKSSDTDANSGPVANFVRNNAEAGATGDALGHIRFMGQDSNSASQRYASITAQIEDPTDGAYYGGLDIAVAYNAQMKGRLSLKHESGQSKFIINEAGDDVDLRVESHTNQNALFLRGSDGNVGIGTGSPTGKLHVSNGSSGATVNSNADDLIIESATNAGISILGDGNETQYLMFGDAADSAVGRVLYDHNTNYMALWTSASEAMRIDSSGNVGIGTTNPSTALDVNGTVTATGLVAGGNTYPTTQGTNGQVLVTDGNGTLSFADQSGGGGSGNVVDDTTPQLGGDLDTNGNDILFKDNDEAKFGDDSDMRIYHTGTTGYIQSNRLYINSANVFGGVVGLVKQYAQTTVANRWLKFQTSPKTDGNSAYFQFHVRGYVNSEAIESHVDYNVYLHYRGQSSGDNLYDLEVVGHEVGAGSLQFGVKFGITNEFYIFVPEDYSGVEVYDALRGEGSNDSSFDGQWSETGTDPTGITFTTPKQIALNNETIEFADGTHAAPSITFANDTDTGISSSIANTLDFSVGGNDRMRLNSSGNLLVGTTTAGSFGARIRAQGRIESSSGFIATSNGTNLEQAGNYGGAGLTIDGYTNSTTSQQKMISFRNLSNSEKGSITVKGNNILFASNGNYLLGASTGYDPTAKLDVDGDTIRLRSDRTPSSATATGNKGDICYDSNYIYVCVATNTWKRTAIDTW